MIKLEGKATELYRVGRARAAALVKVATLEGTICFLKPERATDMETVALREARLDERISELERDVLSHNDQVTAFEVERA